MMPILMLDRTIDNSYGKIDNAFKSDKNHVKKSKSNLNLSLPSLGSTKRTGTNVLRNSYLDSYLRENGELLESLLKSKQRFSNKSNGSKFNSISQRETPKSMFDSMKSRLSNKSFINTPNSYAQKHLIDMKKSKKKLNLFENCQSIEDIHRFRTNELLKKKIRLHYYSDYRNIRNFNSSLSMHSLNSEIAIESNRETHEEELKKIEIKGIKTIRVRDPITSEIRTVKKIVNKKMKDNMSAKIDESATQNGEELKSIANQQLNENQPDNQITDNKTEGSLNEAMSLIESIVCTHCKNGFDLNQEIVNASGDTYHQECFVCAQCFCAFENGVYYEYERRKYCELDFQMLFAPRCKLCEKYINGRVIKASNLSWHPECFKCATCEANLAESGFAMSGMRAICTRCHNEEKHNTRASMTCNKCHAQIDDELIRFKGDTYHAYHFNCTSCGLKLNESSRELRNELYCLKCYDKLQISICAACKQPIENEIVINALGRQWHIQHFVCSHCEKPFLGTRYYEKRNLAFCEYDYKMLFGNRCFVCNSIKIGDEFTACNKCWCGEHFSCYLCEERMNEKTKFFSFDNKPICKKCLEKVPSKVKASIMKTHENESIKITQLWKKEKN